MTNKVLEATNLHGILKVNLTDNCISVQFHPDTDTATPVNVAIDLRPLLKGNKLFGPVQA